MLIIVNNYAHCLDLENCFLTGLKCILSGLWQLRTVGLYNKIATSLGQIASLSADYFRKSFKYKRLGLGLVSGCPLDGALLGLWFVSMTKRQDLRNSLHNNI